MSNFIGSIKRKLPDMIDIFNKKHEAEFVQSMETDFKRVIADELKALTNFLPKEQAENIVNDQFNFND